MEYIWLDYKTPLLSQLPQNFKSAAFLLHPFEKMPDGWEECRMKNKQERFFPTDEELLSLGNPVTWEEVRKASGLGSLEEVAIALQTFIGALNKKYVREDLREKLTSYVNRNLYLPIEDVTSLFLVEDLKKVLASRGAKSLIYSDPILNINGTLEIATVTPMAMRKLAYKELMIADENYDFAFMNKFDSFETILMSKEENIGNIIEAVNLEAIICDSNTSIDWYFDALRRKPI
ncbi:hypothetical protein AB685_15645 [Bacillus sp. LL01]|nr:hypothetical protein AB685_15645 [Bacillus sp. LL01]